MLKISIQQYGLKYDRTISYKLFRIFQKRMIDVFTTDEFDILDSWDDVPTVMDENAYNSLSEDEKISKRAYQLRALLNKREIKEDADVPKDSPIIVYFANMLLSFFDTPRKGQIPRNFESTILSVKIPESNTAIIIDHTD